ncbi:MAG TPA: citramalate synthase [Elusimicrobiota bacterium]|nr:citramalate synthase [Elusimicrobiota bacterium]
MKTNVFLFDSTLRDGTQGEGISLSVDDKLKISRALDDMGIHYIEGGWPGSNPKDVTFFRLAKSLKLKNAKLTAFGSTRRRDKTASQDDNIRALIDVRTPVVCIFGKSWDLHVEHALRATLEENLRMISDSVKYLKSKNREVVYDAEHFFDGFRANQAYALATLKAAWEAGADNLSLCDTNGGSLPNQIGDIVSVVRRFLPRAALGIHVHNDSDCAVANSIIAVQKGCRLVQGCVNGYGERCGNANLVSVIAALKGKMGVDCVSEDRMRYLTEGSRYISELVNIVPDNRQPYVGRSAFAHKGGVHVSAMARHAKTYEHMDPAVVGNKRRILVSELSGKANIVLKAKELKIGFEKDPQAIQRVMGIVKDMEHQGYQFEGAEGSFALLIQKSLRNYKPFFKLKNFRIIVERSRRDTSLVTEATLKIEVDGQEVHTAAEGDGPVEALDRALRKSLERFYPSLREMTLADFKVRVINASAGTGAKVRVLVESRDRQEEWGTVGVSENIIEASWLALVDAVEYKLTKDARNRSSRR